MFCQLGDNSSSLSFRKGNWYLEKINRLKSRNIWIICCNSWNNYWGLCLYFFCLYDLCDLRKLAVSFILQSLWASLVNSSYLCVKSPWSNSEGLNVFNRIFKFYNHRTCAVFRPACVVQRAKTKHTFTHSDRHTRPRLASLWGKLTWLIESAVQEARHVPREDTKKMRGSKGTGAIAKPAAALVTTSAENTETKWDIKRGFYILK